MLTVGNTMRILFFILIALGAASICGAQEINGLIMMDAPGPLYLQIRGDVEFSSDGGVADASKPVLSFQPTEISVASLVPVDGKVSQIQLVFRPDAVKQIRQFIEFNKAKPIRVEIGDYTLPIDLEKTLPWTTGIWLQARPTEKAKTILGTLGKQK